MIWSQQNNAQQACHYCDVIMGSMASQITSLTIVHSTVYSGAHQRKHQSSASLAFVRGIHRWPVNSPHKGPVTREMFPFDDVITVHISIAGTLGCVFIDNETHESGVTKCTTGEAWSAFSWHHSSVFHCQWTHNQVFLLLSHMLI